MNKGIFITFEGPDGSGKSTQAKLLGELLKNKGRDVILTREPGGTPIAEDIRRVILTPTVETLDPMAEILLYAASRAQHVAGLIKPALAEGQIVICDRFVHSSLAYQGYGLGREREVVWNINQLAIGDCIPDLTFVLDVETTEALRRVNQRCGKTDIQTDRIESRDYQFHQRVREGFRQLAAEDNRLVFVNATRKSISTIHQEISKIFFSKFKI